uniref:Uncharacterized protein n=1 Tax=Chromera velia CCMP2878 TaxID=1169474 RepID=A0A0G4FRJ4_9ALVE|eukprot:Cvel_18401.t1-p1 / transcript=Cvel_18401.t1 / gene=Cvel_18401 / organism=Chromera_velia_CCMP2878 / gene_product=hypothetical protein / transcript_product=hypothetical protein / location=Cvel_scaffold1521:35287-39997(+) / protein_length=592 / sequence_SO=supercontig / SO=protein_coding / is_pseudo=false
MEDRFPGGLVLGRGTRALLAAYIEERVQGKPRPLRAGEVAVPPPGFGASDADGIPQPRKHAPCIATPVDSAESERLRAERAGGVPLFNPASCRADLSGSWQFLRAAGLRVREGGEGNLSARKECKLMADDDWRLSLRMGGVCFSPSKKKFYPTKAVEWHGECAGRAVERKARTCVDAQGKGKGRDGGGVLSVEAGHLSACPLPVCDSAYSDAFFSSLRAPTCTQGQAATHPTEEQEGALLECHNSTDNTAAFPLEARRWIDLQNRPWPLPAEPCKCERCTALVQLMEGEVEAPVSLREGGGGGGSLQGNEGGGADRCSTTAPAATAIASSPLQLWRQMGGDVVLTHTSPPLCVDSKEAHLHAYHPAVLSPSQEEIRWGQLSTSPSRAARKFQSSPSPWPKTLSPPVAALCGMETGSRREREREKQQEGKGRGLPPPSVPAGPGPLRLQSHAQRYLPSGEGWELEGDARADAAVALTRVEIELSRRAAAAQVGSSMREKDCAVARGENSRAVRQRCILARRREMFEGEREREDRTGKKNGGLVPTGAWSDSLRGGLIPRYFDCDFSDGMEKSRRYFSDRYGHRKGGKPWDIKR